MDITSKINFIATVPNFHECTFYEESWTYGEGYQYFYTINSMLWLYKIIGPIRVSIVASGLYNYSSNKFIVHTTLVNSYQNYRTGSNNNNNNKSCEIMSISA
jgi:hypothetical protein